MRADSILNRTEAIRERGKLAEKLQNRREWQGEHEIEDEGRCLSCGLWIQSQDVFEDKKDIWKQAGRRSNFQRHAFISTQKKPRKCLQWGRYKKKAKERNEDVLHEIEVTSEKIKMKFWRHQGATVLTNQ